MKKTSVLFVVAALVVCLCADEVMARGGRGGGGRGGGFSGGARPGGSYSRPSSYSRSPSMSRSVSPSYSRPSVSRSPSSYSRPTYSRPSSRPSAGTPQLSRPNVRTGQISRPSPGATRNLGSSPLSRPGGGVAGPRVSNPATAGRSAFQSPGSYQRPSQSQLSNFLNLPGQGGASTLPRTTSRGSTTVRSATSGQGPQSRTYETARGGTITVGGGRGSGTTPGGATVGGAVGGVKVETAGGATAARGRGAVGATDGQNAAIAAGSRAGVQTAGGATAARGSGVRAATDGTNAAVRGGSFAGARDAAGNAVANVRGGYADSSGYRQGGSITGARNQWGYAAVNVRGGYGAGGTGRVGSAAAVRGPAGNVVSAGRGAAYVNGQFVGGRAWTGVNGAYTRWGYFTPGWYGRYPGAWWPGKWAVATTAWTTATWAVAGNYCGCSGDAYYYDYGDSVTYVDGTVYYEDQPVGTAEEYYEQASEIADAGATAVNQEWLPLGVFAIIAEPQQTKTDRVVQLALNKQGDIRGNFQDFLTEEVTPVIGAVDKESQRVALKLEGNDDVVIETGLYNLTNDEVPALVHFGKDRQEPRTLIRLKNPETEE